MIDVDTRVGEFGGHGRPARAGPDDDHAALDRQVPGDIGLLVSPLERGHGGYSPGSGWPRRRPSGAGTAASPARISGP